MFIEYNPNPDRKTIDDCVIRAICKATGKDWETVYIELMHEGLSHHDWPNKNYIWYGYLNRNGFEQHLLPNYCPTCFTVRDFCDLYKHGVYILATGEHVITVVDGNYYDTWDSGDEVPVYVWKYKE